jgi:hypothetical protein
MASNNKLLGSGKVEIDIEPALIPQQFAPAFRYSQDCPEGILVKTDKQLEELDAAGWKDHPGKVQLLPGFKDVWEAEQAKLGGNGESEAESKIDHSESNEKSKSLFEE